ncbi:AAA family ATPase [Prosthecobacter sp.]|uniref:AAA family ATPase n=1 Tax=Prosthecobacter sp. TaxID=1965333 RepID=UPI002AB87548|nr:AAA family ATPase [Prosthecobacter sp.]MDZ4402436.1 AAA family ATPase [Prosthecobacter sp.]
MFTWVPIHQEAAEKLRAYRRHQPELIQVIRDMRAAGLKASSIEDMDADGRRFELLEIDPFTFMGNFNRGVTDTNRTAMWRFLKERWSLTSEVPQDYDGLPILNNQSAWLMPYSKRRDPHHVETLWEVFEVLMKSSPEEGTLTAEMLDACFALRKVGKATLTMGFFWCRPQAWPALDRKNIAFAKTKGVTTEPDDGASYLSWIHELRRVVGPDVIEFSRQAHLWAESSPQKFGHPFDFMFDDRQQADVVLDRLRSYLFDLDDGDNTGGVRLIISSKVYQTTKAPKVPCTAFRIMYGRWVVMDYGASKTEKIVRLVLREDSPIAAQASHRWSVFEIQIDGHAYAVFTFELDEYLENVALQQEHLAVSLCVRDHFRSMKRSPYSEDHRPELWQLIMEPNSRTELLLQGLKEVAQNKARPIWLIAPGENAKLLPEWREQSHITIGWGKTGDLSHLTELDQVREALATTEPDAGKNIVGSMLHDFAQGMQEGDEVFLKGGLFRILGRGVVRGEYEFVEGAAARHCHQRSVEWLDDRGMDVPDGVQLPQVTLSRLEDKAELMAAIREFYSSNPDTSVVQEQPGNSSAAPNYWWFNCNPDIWDIESRIEKEKVSNDEVEVYTAVNQNGRKRQKPQWFAAARPGDLAIAYVTSPKRFAVAICRVTRGMAETGGVGVGFSIIEKLRRPVLLDEMKAQPLLKASEPLSFSQASILRLTKAEFDSVIELAESDVESAASEPSIYDMGVALKDLFMMQEKLESICTTLRRKKNLVLQGAPGTGKTFVARRLAYLLMGVKDESRAPMVQFHQSMSYEDFVQGYRPDGNGGFVLRDGPFYRFCRQAMTRPDDPHVFIIDEINRGNLSKILGELMMLIESDKRSPSYALPLTYTSSHEDRFYVPENVFIIGTMNTADRSLSMVDYALRRRFAFVEMEPGFAHPAFRSFLESKKISPGVCDRIIQGMALVNERITGDAANLGSGYRIGHSFFVPNSEVHDAEGWLTDVLTHEVLPLLQEYWVDDPKGLGAARQALGI